MNSEAMVRELNQEISKLTQARDLLMGTTAAPEGKRRGRPPGSGLSIVAESEPSVAPKKSGMTPEGKARLADAMRQRWAAKKASISTPAKAVKKSTKK